MKRKPYPSDLTDEQWDVLASLLPSAKTGGRPRTVDLREAVNGIVYVLRNGCTWRAMPHDLPPWGTVWWYFREWRQDGTWERVHEALRPKVRKAEGSNPTPRRPCGPKFGRPKAATQHLAHHRQQSVKTTEKGGQQEGQRSKATHHCRYHGVAAGGGGASCQYPG